jgi:hypothetical protein
MDAAQEKTRRAGEGTVGKLHNLQTTPTLEACRRSGYFGGCSSGEFAHCDPVPVREVPRHAECADRYSPEAPLDRPLDSFVGAGIFDAPLFDRRSRSAHKPSTFNSIRSSNSSADVVGMPARSRSRVSLRCLMAHVLDLGS